ncbi:hypothetical protein LINGRAPRIM_LOCUS2173 [Linum grandiflorum]
MFPERHVASSRSCSPSVRDGAAHSPHRDDRGRGYKTARLDTASGDRDARDDAAVLGPLGCPR